MATARLSDDERSSIVNTIERITARALLNKEFPIAKEDATAWVISQLPKPIRKAYLLLKADEPELVTEKSYASDFRIKSDTMMFQIGIDAPVPRDHILVQPSDVHHADIIKWAEWEVDIKKKVDAADSYISELVYSCTSVGQLKRLLPQEIMRFIPKHLLDFSEVERRSRIPASFTPVADDLESMMNMLTLGAISPEKRKGMKAWTEYTEEIEA